MRGEDLTFALLALTFCSILPYFLIAFRSGLECNLLGSAFQ